MEHIPSDKAARLFEEALRYDQAGDVYHAVKLFKRVIRLDPQWLLPYLQLAAIYKKRKEWKSVLNYCKKAVSLDAAGQSCWWDLSIAAAALGKDRLARNIWQKFSTSAGTGSAVSLRLEHSGIFELTWAQAVDPVRAVLLSIPHPDSGMQYRDVVLFDREQVGINVAGRKKIPIFPVLDRVKRSFFQTFTCVLHQVTPKSLQTLEELCQNAGQGFEIWSNAAWSKIISTSDRIPEFYGNQVFPAAGEDGEVWVALAARKENEALEVLNNWRIICLKTFSDFEPWG